MCEYVFCREREVQSYRLNVQNEITEDVYLKST
jgi:hypothetical protein